MACVSRMFGGLHSGDVRALRWEHFESAGGAFSKGWAPRKKTARPQALEVPEVLRPILRDWWERSGRPTTGLVFGVRIGADAGKERKPGRFALSLRRDLRRAFGIDEPRMLAVVRNFPNGELRADTRITWLGNARPLTERERQLFTPTEFTKPVDFHSFRRQFKQSLAGAGIDIQLSMTLSGATDPSAHRRYLNNTARARELPGATLSSLSIVDAETVFEAADTNGKFAGFTECRSPDLNRGQRAYEARALTN
jgi:integrase